MQKYVNNIFSLSEKLRVADSPSDSPSPRTRRSALSPAARSLRLQRIFARLQDGAAYAEIAAEEGFSRERLRQIIRVATAPGRGHDGPDHKRMQIARLTPALRLAADGVAQGDAKSIPLLLKIIDRLDRYFDPLDRLAQFVHGPATRAILEARKTGRDETRFCQRRPRPIGRGGPRMPLAS